MHRKLLKITRIMIFSCALPLQYRSDSIKYVVHILNRNPTRASAKKASPIEVLTGEVRGLRGIVVFWVPCSRYRDMRKKALQQRSHRGIIVDVSEETNAYKVIFFNRNKVIVMQRQQHR